MKKTVICFLLLVVFLSLTSASSEWAISHCLDDFGDETEEIYLSSGIQTGTYTDEQDIDSPLKWQLIIKENAVSFKLTKNETQLVRYNSNNDEYTGSFYVVLRDDNKNDYDFDAYIDGSEIYFEETDATSLLRLLAVNKAPRIIIYETRWLSSEVYNMFKLGVVDTEGFSELYEEAYGVDWSLPLSIELFPEQMEVFTYDDEIQSIGVSVFLGSQKIYFQYQTSFDWELVRTIDDDYGFFGGYRCHINSEGNVDYNNIYLNHMTELTNERSGYITVQIGEVVEQCYVSVVDKPIETTETTTPLFSEENNEPISVNSDESVRVVNTSEGIIETLPENSVEGVEEVDISEEIEDFTLYEFYRGGEILIKATFTNTSGKLVFSLDANEIRSVLSYLSKYTDSFDNISYTLSGSLMELSYPVMSKDEVEDYWLDFKFFLNAYNEKFNPDIETEDNELVVSKSTETVKGTLSALIYPDRAEITIPEGMSDEEFIVFINVLAERYPEFNNYGTLVWEDAKFVLTYSDSFSNRLAAEEFERFVEEMDYWLETKDIAEIEENSSVEKTETAKTEKPSPETIFRLRGRVEFRPSLNYKGKIIEGTYRGITKTGENDTHALIGTILEARYFVSDNLFLSLSGGLSFYSYSFKEQLNTIYKKTTNTYNDIVLGGLVELGIGYQKGNFYGDIRFGIVKTVKPEYNENTNLIFGAVFGFYYVEVGLGLDYNIAENKLRFQSMIALSVPLCHVSKEKGSYTIDPF